MNEILLMVRHKVEGASAHDVLWSMFAFTAMAMTWSGYMVSSLLTRRHERRMRERRREDRCVEVVFFDVTRKNADSTATLRSQPIAAVRIDDESWDSTQRKLLSNWDSRETGLIVRPKKAADAEALADRIYTLASCTLSSSIPAIRGYLQDDQIADERDGFKHVRFLACLTRPHASAITWKDSPRLIIVPIGTARKLTGLSDSEVHCKHSAQNRKVWLTLIREMGAAYRDSEIPLSERAIATVDIGFEH